MNQKRRDTLRLIAERLGEIKGEIDAVRDEEQEAFDNSPESLQGGERGQAMEAAVEMMDDAMNDIDTAITALEGAQE